MALDALKEMDAVRAERTRAADADAAARATPRVDAVIFPADALRAFSATDVETSGCMRPYADARSSLGVVFGTWSEMLARGGSGGGGWRARSGSCSRGRASVAEALVAWLCSEDAVPGRALHDRTGGLAQDDAPDGTGAHRRGIFRVRACGVAR